MTFKEKELNLCDTCKVRIHEDKTPGCNLRIDAITLSPYGKVINCFRYSKNKNPVNKPISPHDAYEKSQRVIQESLTGREYTKSGKAILEELEKTFTLLEFHLKSAKKLLEKLK